MDQKFSKIKQKEFISLTGGNLKKIICGGALLSSELCQFYWDMGIPVYIVYGTTETMGPIAINLETENKLGTVGKPFPDYEIEISNNGELRIRGSNVMKGYYKNPEITKTVLDKNGWYNTGDIMSLDEDGYLNIIGRKSEIFKLTVGNFINPSSIEDKFKTNPIIKQIVIVGDNRSFLSALIVPDIEYLLNLVHEDEISFSGIKDLFSNNLILTKYSAIIDSYNDQCLEYETIKKFKLLESNFSVEGGELTSTFKINRKIILQKYEKIINSFYEK